MDEIVGGGGEGGGPGEGGRVLPDEKENIIDNLNVN